MKYEFVCVALSDVKQKKKKKKKQTNKKKTIIYTFNFFTHTLS